jgi:hypothetical protein
MWEIDPRTGDVVRRVPEGEWRNVVVVWTPGATAVAAGKEDAVTLLKRAQAMHEEGGE